MTDASKSMRKSKKAKRQVEILKLNRETVQDLTDREAVAAEDGRIAAAAASDKDTCQCTVGCTASCFICR